MKAYYSDDLVTDEGSETVTAGDDDFEGRREHERYCSGGVPFERIGPVHRRYHCSPEQRKFSADLRDGVAS